MPSPVGHSLIGYSFYLWWSARSGSKSSPGPSSGPKIMLFFIVMANLPDVDFLISWIITGNPNDLHYGWTHTLVFALIVSAFAGMYLRLKNGPWKSAWIVLAVVASHTVVDFLTGPDWGFHRTYGISWLAPLTMERIQSPFTLFVGTRHNDLDQVLTLHNLIWVGYELVLLLPAVLWIRYRHGRRVIGKDPS